MLDSTPTASPRSRSAARQAGTSGSVNVCGSQNAWYAASAALVPLAGRLDADRAEDLVEGAPTAGASRAGRPRLVLGSEQPRGEPVGVLRGS